jgi:hypothetical protein
MTPDLQILLGSIVGGSGAILSYWAGWRARGDVMRIRGGVIGRPPLIFNKGRIQRGNNHENTAPNSSEERPLRLRRSGDSYSSGPTTPKPDIIPKPQPPPGRIINDWGETIGYRPLPQRGIHNPPPRDL